MGTIIQYDVQDIMIMQHDFDLQVFDKNMEKAYLNTPSSQHCFPSCPLDFFVGCCEALNQEKGNEIFWQKFP